MGSEQSSLANSNTNPGNTGKDLTAEGRRGRKSQATEVTTARTSTTTSLLSGDFEPATTLEATRALVAEDDITEESSILDDSSDEESDDEEDEQGEFLY